MQHDNDLSDILTAPADFSHRARSAELILAIERIIENHDALALLGVGFHLSEEECER
jgi:hypothetical protein